MKTKIGNQSEKSAVAHFRRRMFLPTETFIYNYFQAFGEIKPVGITYKRVNEELFPTEYVIEEIYRWDALSKFYRKAKEKVLRKYFPLQFDTRRTYSAIRSHDIRILHAHFGYTGVELLGVKEHTRLPLVTTFYGEDVSAIPQKSDWKSKYQALFQKGDLFLTEGPHMKKRLIELGCPPEKLNIQRIAIQVDRYPFRNRGEKKSDQGVQLLFCGTFREKKGLIYALRAVLEVRNEFPNIHFTIVGDGPLNEEVRSFVESHGMNPYVSFKGFLTHQEMIYEMAGADLFIHPSVTAKNGNSEGGAPTVLLEAQACGLPVLSTYHADIPYVVKDGQSGLLAPERNVELLADNLAKLLKDPHKWPEYGSAGRKNVEENHDILKEVKKLEEKYLKLLS